MNETQVRKRRWLFLFAGVVAMLFAGVIYSWSILKAPLAEEFGWKPAELALNYTLTMSFFCVGNILAGLLLKKTAPRVPAFLGALLAAAGFFLASRLSGANILALYASYALFCGTGIGLTYNTILTTTGAWFPDRKGFCSGFLMMGFGFSTLLLGSLAGKLIILPTVGWRTTYVILAAAIFVVLLVVGLIMKLPPKDALFPAGKPPRQERKADFAPQDFATGQMLGRGSFWLVFLFNFLVLSTGMTVVSFARDFFISLNAAVPLAVFLVGVISVSNGLGRLIEGWAFDSQGRRFALMLSSTLALSATLLLLGATLTSSLALGVIAAVCSGLAFGSSPTVQATMIRSFYGNKNFAMNFSIMTIVSIPAASMATVAGKLVGTTGSYVSTFCILAGMAALSFICVYLLRRP